MYTAKDVRIMIDAFGTIEDLKNKEDYAGILNELIKVKGYPISVLQEFLQCMEDLSLNNISEDKYWAIIGYVLIRINLVKDVEVMDF